MKKGLKMMMASLFAACTMFSQAAFSVCAAENNGTADNTLTYEDCLRMAEVLHVDARELYEKRDEDHIPKDYIAFVSANDNYISGSVVMSLTYDTDYLTYAGYSSGSHGSVTSYSGNVTSGSWMSCIGTASLGTYTTDPKPSWVVFVQNFTVSASLASTVWADIYSGSPSTITLPSISSANVNGNNIPSSDYANYFTYGFRALGDVKNDNVLNASDVQTILDYLSDPISNPLSEEQLASADVTQDGRITVSDAIAVYYLW